MTMTTLSSTVKRLESIAARITYKPWVNLRFDFDYDITARGIKVVMVTRVPDSMATPDVHNTLPRIPVISDDTRPFEYFDQMDEEAVLRYLYTLLSSFERHEQGEWFRVDGERKYNPHGDD